MPSPVDSVTAVVLIPTELENAPALTIAPPIYKDFATDIPPAMVTAPPDVVLVASVAFAIDSPPDTKTNDPTEGLVDDVVP